MHRSVVKAALPALEPALPQQARAQSMETGHAVYAGSIKPRARIRLQRLRAHRREDGKPPGDALEIHSREGEAHRPAVGPEGYRSDDIRRCVKMAMDPWEGALSLPGTITIHSRLNEGPSPAVGVGGAVTYPSAGGAATPASHYCQHSPRAGAAGTIETNPNACRDSPWGHEDPYGCLHPTSAPLRRTAQGHIHSRPRHGRQQGPQESGGPRQ